MILETRRLYMREMTQDDFPQLCRYLQDPEVMYAYEHPFSDDEVHALMDKQYLNYARFAFGIWAVILKDTSTLIGQCGLTMQPCGESEVLEIGYIFGKEYWHKGYAIEAAKACRDYAFETLGADEVFSLIRDTNLASQHVAKRNGMVLRGTYIKHYNDINMPHHIFSIKRNSMNTE